MSDSKKRPAPVDIAERVAEAQRRAQAVNEARARALAIAGKANGSQTPPPPAPAAKPMSKLDEIKARVAAAARKTAATAATPPPRAPSTRPPPPPTFEERPRTDLGKSSRGGLHMDIHPTLLGGPATSNGTKDGKSKDRNEEKVEKDNKYFPSEEKWSGRASRRLNFTHNLHDRPAMQAAAEIKKKAFLEQMKKSVDERAAQAGLEDGADTQVFMVPMPPAVEFWDEGLQGDLDKNALISQLVNHPIPIDPPQDKFTSSKPMTMYLTAKEQKKMRRIRRAEEHKEEQAKIRLGLVPTPAPKIKHTNVMRVYGEMAVQDPTAVEAMVNKQIQDRKTTHEEANAARQLTKEQKAEKIKKKSEENAALGLYLSVFKIALTKEQLLGKHRYKIDKNAKDWHDITGFVAVAPKFSLVVVEAGAKATKEYAKLLTKRTKWQLILQGNGEILQNATESNEAVEDNTCTLLHQGQIKARKMKKWGSFRDIESDSQGRDVLSRLKLETFWTQAKAAEPAS